MERDSSVGFEEEDCSRQGDPEQTTTGNQSAEVSISKKKKKKKKEREKKKKSQLCKMECTQRDKMTGTVAR